MSLIKQFIRAETWTASRRIVEQHPELLNAEAELHSVLNLLPGHGTWTAYREQAMTDALWQALPAAMWDVTNSLTATFAAAFYEATLHNPGRTLALAVCAVRQPRAAGDPTWLAYSLYAHPNARLMWDGSRG
ncbi:MAG: hypothetical protein V9H69_12640 [Anaerolineae bacterium]